MKKLLIFLLFIQTLFAYEKVTLQLKWLHQFQFAGYYMAKEKGYYTDVGLDVEIKQRNISKNNVTQVIKGEAEYGISDSILLLYKARKEPVVIVSPVFQHSPSVLLTLKESSLNSPYELDKKIISFYKKDTDGFTILAMLKSTNVNPSFDRVSGQRNYMDLIEKKSDAYAAYLTNEPFYLKEKGIEINIINPSNYGFDFYGDMIFTNKNEVENHPKRVENFKNASLKGWEYALNNKEETIQLIKTKYAKNKSIKHLKYEANAIEQVIQHKYIPLGTLDEGRIKYTLKKYAEYGLITNDINLNEFIFSTNNKKIKLTKEEKAWLKNNPKIKLITKDEQEPFIIKSGENSYDGILVDYIKEINKIIGQKIELLFLKNNETKISKILVNPNIYGVPVVSKEENEKNSLVLTNPYMNTSFEIFINEKNQGKITSFNDLKNKRIAILKNDQIIDSYLKEFKNTQLIYTKTHKEQLSLLQYEKVDAVLGYSNYNYLISKMLFDKIIPAFTFKDDISIHMGIKEKDKIFVSILNKAIENIGENKKQEIINKWLDKKKHTLQLTKEENKYLKNKKYISMCIDPNWMPYEKIEEGKHVGISSDYISFMEKKIGIPITLIKTSSWLQSLEYSRKRKCDILSLVIPTKSRKEYLDFTQPYIKAPMVVATKIDEPFIGDIKNLEKKNIGIVQGFAYIEILKQRYPKINIIEVPNLHEGLLKVQNNDIYGLVGTLGSIGFNIQKDFIGQIKIAGKFDESWDLGIATRNDEPMLKTIFDKAIKAFPSDKKQAITNKWISINYQKGINYFIIFQWVGAIIFIFSIILFIVVKANKKLNIEITNRKNAEQKLQGYINLVDENIITSSTNLLGDITEVSMAFCKTSGYTKEELLGQRHSIIRHEEMDINIYKEIWEKLIINEPWEGEIKNKTKQGNTYWVKAYISPIYDEEQEKIGYTSITQDITNKKLLEEISITDELTKIYNRRHFNTILPTIINRAKRKNENISFVILDVDYFKLYNDTYGHIKGDEALIKVAKCLKDSFHRADDYCFRLGGEEFGLLFKDTKKEKAIKLVNKVRIKLENLGIEHKENSASKYLTASFGLVTIEAAKIREAQSLYKQADKLLYKAKEEGRNKVESN